MSKQPEFSTHYSVACKQLLLVCVIAAEDFQ